MVIDPRNMTRNSDGFVWREFACRLPQGMVLDELKDPGIWRHIQKGPNALRKHDKLYLIEYGEAWAAECRVIDGDREKAVLSKPVVVTFGERYDKLFETDEFRVAWWGIGYGVERKSDAHRMTAPVHSKELAERDLRNQYAKAA